MNQIQWNYPASKTRARAIHKLKNNKALRVDGIPGELFKYGGDQIDITLRELITKMWTTEMLPEEW